MAGTTSAPRPTTPRRKAEPPAVPVFMAESGVHGRGVFAARAFKTGDLVEECPVLVCGASELRHLERTALRGYYFEWADDGVGLALGLGSLYNHSSAPNAEVEADYEGGVVRYVATRPIKKGEEVMIDYTGGTGAVELWFDPAPSHPRTSGRNPRKP